MADVRRRSKRRCGGPETADQEIIDHQVDALLAREKLIRAGGERRGNSKARAKRALDLVEEFGGSREPIEDAVVPCVYTGVMLAGSKEAAAKQGLDMLHAGQADRRPRRRRLQAAEPGPGVTGSEPVARGQAAAGVDEAAAAMGKPGENTPTVVAANKPARSPPSSTGAATRSSTKKGRHPRGTPREVPERVARRLGRRRLRPAGSEQGQAELPTVSAGSTEMPRRSTRAP